MTIVAFISYLHFFGIADKVQHNIVELVTVPLVSTGSLKSVLTQFRRGETPVTRVDVDVG